MPEVIVDNLDSPCGGSTGPASGTRTSIGTAWGQFCFLWDPEGNPLQFYESAFIRPDADPDRIPG